MTGPELHDLPRLFGAGDAPASGAQLPYAGPSPRIDVDDFGQVHTPLQPAELQRLLSCAQPAAYGKGEETLVDRQVRDTWQIPPDLVTVDWHGLLDEVVESARRALGLPVGAALRAQFHSMLVYERGQFFLPHQDSQKDDDMVATLVVMMPSTGTGGELVVHDGEHSTTFDASRDEARLVVFYSDRLHEVLPVCTGHRVALTYNLLVSGDTRGAATPSGTRTQVAALLQDYFSTPQSPRYGGSAQVPTRLAYLLDHEYPERGLSLTRLKGADAAAAGVLAAAAEDADCEVVLALTEVREVRDGDGTDGYLIDSEVEVTHWLTSHNSVESASLSLGDDVTAATATSRLRPTAQEFEGYMGNYGNTTDRWYRRAALLVWPRRLAFANRAEGAPAVAMAQIVTRLESGDPGAQDDLAGMADAGGPLRISRGPDAGTLLTVTLAAATHVSDVDLARRLLAPFGIEDLRVEASPHLVALADRHGEKWVKALLRGWFGDRRRLGPRGGIRATELPDLARGLSTRAGVARELVTLAHDSLQRSVELDLLGPLTESARQRRRALAEPIAALAEAIAIVDSPTLRRKLLSWCRHDALVDTLVDVLAVARSWPDNVQAAAGVPHMVRSCIACLHDRAARPPRAPQDWSIGLNLDCRCDLCETLGEFLSDRERREMDWPLAQRGRQHVHSQLDRYEVPATHVTRREGRPFTLVLTKTSELFEWEDRGREQAQRQLEEVQRDWA